MLYFFVACYNKYIGGAIMPVITVKMGKASVEKKKELIESLFYREGGFLYLPYIERSCKIYITVYYILRRSQYVNSTSR
ncbi:MAG: hypothetical protein H6Q69_1675 [Firmicutes bacterium]|nr:hypothetical protein [Bacillota bacterium]